MPTSTSKPEMYVAQFPTATWTLDKTPRRDILKFPQATWDPTPGRASIISKVFLFFSHFYQASFKTREKLKKKILYLMLWNVVLIRLIGSWTLPEKWESQSHFSMQDTVIFTVGVLFSLNSDFSMLLPDKQWILFIFYFNWTKTSGQ